MLFFLDFDSFNAELILEAHTLAVCHHRKGCEEIRSLSSTTELLGLSLIKNAFTNFKAAAGIFNYVSTELCKNQKWSHKSI